MNTVTKIVSGVFVTCALGWAQTTSQINGSVRDSSGLNVPGAEVKATQTATGAVRTVTTGADGSYVLTNLPIGPYLLEVSKDGFSKYAQSGILLQVDSNPTIDVALKVGAVTEQVLVQADATLVETHSTGVGQVVDSQRVVEMPLNGRNATELIFLAGMATIANGNAVNSVRNYPTIPISVGGGVAGGITYLLDGANHNDAHNNLNLPLPFPDALQEFKVETSALPAQYGIHSAATVNAVTKSGTNEFHGDLFEFLRNGDLNARDFFATARDTLKRNQFGGTVGGPVKKDKLFFFAGYQGTIQKSTPPQTIAYVPTAAMLAGDFTAFASPACNANRQLTLAASQGFTNNQIAPAKLNQVAVNLEKLVPISTDPCGKVTYGLVNNLTENLGVTRIDYQKSEKHSLFGRLTVSDLDVPSTYDGKDPITISVAGAHYRVYSLAGGDTYLINPNIVSSFRISANRSKIPKVADDFTTWAALGSNVSALAPGHQAMLAVTGNGFTISGGNGVTTTNATGPSPNVSDDISWVKGAHQIGFGASYLHNTAKFQTAFRAPGSFTFSGQTTGAPLADYLIGSASSFVQGTIGYWDNRQHYIGLYVQDSWKVTSRLTVNYGVRFEPYLAPSSKYGYYTHFDQSLFNQGVHSTVYPNGPAGLIVPGDPQYTIGNAPEGSRIDKFVPRVGLVWDPKGDGRMTVRAAYGMFTDRQYTQSYTSYGTNPPVGDTITLANVSLTNPWASVVGGNPFPLSVNKNLVFPMQGNYLTSPFDYKPPYMNQWNISIQRQIGTDWLVTVNYLGNNIIHLNAGTQLNPALFLGLGSCTLPNGVTYPVCSTTGNTNQRRVLALQNWAQGQYYAGVNQIDDGGTGTYDGLFFSVQRRLNRGVSALANYTWSHCISDAFEQQLGIANAISIPGNRREFRSNCVVSDQRQIFNLSVVAQTPKFSNRMLRMLASEWQISPIMKIKSAQLFSVTTGIDNALSGQPTQVPNLVGNPYPSNQTITNWLNTSAFAAPAPGTYGNLGLNIFKGPGIFQFDMALTRTFQIREKKALQVRADAFNLPNHLNPSVPGTGSPIVTATNSATYTQILSDISGTSGLSAGDYRIIQLALKLMF